MKTQKSTSPKLTTSLLFVAIVTGLILLIPAIAMQFTDDVKWTLSDFIIMGLLIFTAGTVYVFGSRQAKNLKHKVMIGLCIAAVLIAIWIELAVGVFGTPFAGS